MRWVYRNAVRFTPCIPVLILVPFAAKLCAGVLGTGHSAGSNDVGPRSRTMTVAAAYLTSEGVVLGADSASTVSRTTPDGVQQVAQVFDYAQKVFEVGDPGQGRLGICTWGSGRIGQTSHRTVITRLADIVERESLGVEAAADKLLELATEARSGERGEIAGVGYFLGGWDLESHNPGCFYLWLGEDSGSQKRALNLGEARFAGMPQFFTRIFRGYDPGLASKLKDILKQKLGENAPAEFDLLFEAAFEEAAGPLAAVGFRDLPLREAIDYIHAYLRITVKVRKFMFGPPVCGGPVEVAFISTDRKFRWVCHKGFDAAIGEEQRCTRLTS